MDLTPTKPYLIRALYEWILDNDLTPHLLVDAEDGSVEVPREFVADGQIVLNLSPSAIRSLDLGNDWVYFNARFAGKPQDVHVPIYAVKAIYAMENNKGMVFVDDENQPSPTSPDGSDTPVDSSNNSQKKPGSKKPVLRVIK